MISSTIPSAKYSCSGSPLILANGKTAIDGLSGSGNIVYSYRGLYRNRALDGIDRAGEVGDDAIPGGVEDSPPMRRDQLIDGDTAGLQPGERANLVTRHQPAIAGNVSGEDRGEF